VYAKAIFGGFSPNVTFWGVLSNPTSGVHVVLVLSPVFPSGKIDVPLGGVSELSLGANAGFPALRGGIPGSWSGSKLA